MRRLSLALAVLVAGVGLAPVQTDAAPPPPPGFSTAYARIPGAGGTELGAVVLTPTGQGAGPFPLIVMPSSWGFPNLEYVGQGAKLAKGGFQVISYSSRGFWDSAGAIDIAGPPTITDVSKVIDWADDNTPADTTRVAAAGISYGAGVALLAGAQDPRIKAVGALSGWADLIAAVNPNNTVSVQALAILLGLGNLTGRPGPEMQSIQTKLVTGDVDEAMAEATALSPVRSAKTFVNQLNANRPAIFMANAFEDSLLPGGQYADFFNRLTGPKRLHFAHGDHLTPELLGTFGLPNEVWDDLTLWFKHYLTGADNGADREAPVQLKSQQGVWRSYPNWAAVGTPAKSYLSKPTGLSRTGALQPKATTGWSNGIRAGVPTLADSGVAILSGALQGFLSVPVGVATPLVDRGSAGVWSGPAYSSKRVVNGRPQLHVTVTPSAPDTSLFAYLYDVDALGVGSLISHKPYTLRGATPGQPKSLDLKLEPTSWEVPAGHHLVLVVDTVDPRYLGRSKLGSSVSFSSPAADPAWLSVPVA